MQSCLVAHVKHFYESRVRHIFKMEKLEIRAVIKYFWYFKEILEDFMETIGKESHFYRAV